MLVELLVVDLINIRDALHQVIRNAIRLNEVDSFSILPGQLKDLVVRHLPKLIANTASQFEHQHGFPRLCGVLTQIFLLGHSVELELLFE